jgi:hypothetical protein
LPPSPSLHARQHSIRPSCTRLPHTRPDLLHPLLRRHSSCRPAAQRRPPRCATCKAPVTQVAPHGKFIMATPRTRIARPPIPRRRSPTIRRSSSRPAVTMEHRNDPRRQRFGLTLAVCSRIGISATEFRAWGWLQCVYIIAARRAVRAARCDALDPPAIHAGFALFVATMLRSARHRPT